MPEESTAGPADRYVLYEINASSVAPFPPSSIGPLVAAVKKRLTERRTKNGDP
jgi:hypothetical protein